MCIRDRFLCSPIRTHYGERSTAAPMDVDNCSHETAAGSGETHSEAVSYTHLTLPTICSV
eukprot:3042497-Prorocentrum_lima.AAC.1